MQVCVATHLKNCYSLSRINDVACLASVVMNHNNARPHTAAAMQNLIMSFGWEPFNHPLTAQTYCQMIFICSCILHPSLLASGSTKTIRSKKLLPCALHSRRRHSTVKGYKNWCNAMTSAWRMVETESKSSVWCAHQMVNYRICNILLFFLNSPSELTFWITYICNTSFTYFESAYGV